MTDDPRITTSDMRCRPRRSFSMRTFSMSYRPIKDPKDH